MIRRTRLLLLAATAWPLFGCELPDRTPDRPPAVAIALRAPTSPLRAGQSAQLEAALLTQQGDSVPGRVTWAGSNTEIATVTTGGRYIAGTKPGAATITATSEGLSGSALVTVAAPARRFPWKEGAVFCRFVRCERVAVAAGKELRSQYDYYRWRNRRRIGFLLGALAVVALGLAAFRRRTGHQLAPA